MRRQRAGAGGDGDGDDPGRPAAPGFNRGAMLVAFLAMVAALFSTTLIMSKHTATSVAVTSSGQGGQAAASITITEAATGGIVLTNDQTGDSQEVKPDDGSADSIAKYIGELAIFCTQRLATPTPRRRTRKTRLFSRRSRVEDSAEERRASKGLRARSRLQGLVSVLASSPRGGSALYSTLPE